MSRIDRTPRFRWTVNEPGEEKNDFLRPRETKRWYRLYVGDKFIGEVHSAVVLDCPEADGWYWKRWVDESNRIVQHGWQRKLASAKLKLVHAAGLVMD